MNGIFWKVSVSRLSSSPPMAKLCPSLSSTSVFTLRMSMEGIWNPETSTALVKSRELTSGATWRRMVPRGVMVGMKFRRTPNSLNRIVTDPPTPPAIPCTTGYGYSPPARKLACLPLAASTLGSARTSTSPSVTNASMVAPRFRSGRKKKRFSALDIVAAAEVPPPGSETVGAGNCPVVRVPRVLAAPVLNRFKPSCLVKLRSTLANFTFKRICGSADGTLTYSRLTTLPAVDAICTARSELVRSFTVPRRKMSPFSKVTRTA